MDVVIYCADIGSIKSGNFGWARGVPSSRSVGIREGTDIAALTDSVAEDLNERCGVALGFECPLFVPFPDDPIDLTSARRGEGSRPWSAAAGAASLATGLTESAWILREIRRRIRRNVKPFVDWSAFCEAGRGLFLWEAMVTGSAKGDTHTADAENAVRSFAARMSDLAGANAISETNVHSLIGAALLRTGWSTELSLLQAPCLVIRA